MTFPAAAASEDLVTTEDVREHMRGTLEAIANSDCHLFSARETCPVCMARFCLQEIDVAEERGLL